MTIYRDEHLRKLLLKQMLEKVEQAYLNYKKLELPTYQLAQWRDYYIYKMKRAYIMKGESSLPILKNDFNGFTRNFFSHLGFTVTIHHNVRNTTEAVLKKWTVFFYAMILMINSLKN